MPLRRSAEVECPKLHLPGDTEVPGCTDPDLWKAPIQSHIGRLLIQKPRDATPTLHINIALHRLCYSYGALLPCKKCAFKLHALGFACCMTIWLAVFIVKVGSLLNFESARWRYYSSYICTHFIPISDAATSTPASLPLTSPAPPARSHRTHSYCVADYMVQKGPVKYDTHPSGYPKSKPSLSASSMRQG